MEHALLHSVEFAELQKGFPALRTPYPTRERVTGKPHTGISEDLREVARLISAQKVLEHERHLFSVGHRNWDTHNTGYEDVYPKLKEIDDSLKLFVSEMKAQGMWNSVTLVISSDFGRTLTSNGKGTDVRPLRRVWVWVLCLLKAFQTRWSHDVEHSMRAAMTPCLPMTKNAMLMSPANN